MVPVEETGSLNASTGKLAGKLFAEGNYTLNRITRDYGSLATLDTP